MSRYGTISLSLMNFQMMRVISSPSISTTGFATLIFAILQSHLLRAGVGPPDSVSERGERGVQRGARPHRGGRLGEIRQVVPAHVDRLALCADQLAVDLGFVLAERLGQRLEAGLQLRVLGLRGQRLSPVQGEVEMAAAIVELADLARRITVELEELADGRVERVGKNLG